MRQIIVFYSFYFLSAPSISRRCNESQLCKRCGISSMLWVTRGLLHLCFMLFDFTSTEEIEVFARCFSRAGFLIFI